MFLYLCPLSAVCESVSVSVPFFSVQRFLSCRRSNTRRWPNAGLMFSHHLRHWANISQHLDRVVFAATLNVGQCHRCWPTLTQLWFKASWQYRQHASTASMKYWLRLIGYRRRWLNIYQTLSRCRLVLATSSLHCQTAQPSKHKALNQYWFDTRPASQMMGKNWTSIGWTSRVCWDCWQATLCFAHRRVWRY